MSKWHKVLLSIIANIIAVSIWHKKLLSPMANTATKETWHIPEQYIRLQLFCCDGNEELRFKYEYQKVDANITILSAGGSERVIIIKHLP